MIQFHRRLRPVRVISFDLDDTLYDNAPVMARAEQQLADYLAAEYPAIAYMQPTQWRELRETIASEARQQGQTELTYNMTALRQHALRRGLTEAGVAPAELEHRVADAMDFFLHHRNQVEVAEDVHQLLAALAQRWPLVAISNGNADLSKIGLADYFSGHWQPDSRLRGKPTTDMFEAACTKLGAAPQQWLHIGDHPVSDIQGAARFGAQTIWLNESGRSDPRLTWLPTLTIHHLPVLADLLT